MIRRLIILLLIVGCVFGDTITYNQGNNKRTIENVKFIRAGNGKVYFKAHGQETSRYCNRIIEFTDDDGNPIEYDCSAVLIEESLIDLEKKIEDTISKEEVESIIQKIKKPVAGGLLIGIGGALVFTTLGKECGDGCELSGTSQSALVKWAENTKEFEDGILDTQKIGFGLIALGGILVAFGI